MSPERSNRNICCRHNHEFIWPRYCVDRSRSVGRTGRDFGSLFFLLREYATRQTEGRVIRKLNRPRNALQTRMTLASRRNGRVMTLTEVFFLGWAIVCLIVVLVLLRGR
jgi:hypothetical protein